MPVDLESAVGKYVENQRILIDLEYQEQVAGFDEKLKKLTKRQLQKQGLALLSMKVDSQATGLAGKSVIEFGGGFENALPSHHFKVGDVARVERASQSATGVVTACKEGSITMAFEEFPDDLKDGLTIMLLPNDISFKRMKYALTKLVELPKLQTHNELLNTVFDPDHKIFTPSDPENFKLFYNDDLNDIQKKAVIRSACSNQSINLIHGPPGTGKTETIIEVIKQIAKPLNTSQSSGKPKKILVCAPSNLAVDNIVERLGSDQRFSLVRLGHPARMLDGVVKFSLDYQLIQGDQSALIKDIRKDIDGLVNQLPKSKARREIYSQLKDLRKELKVREKNSIQDLFRSTQIILCTLNMAGSKKLNGLAFDVAIIDEASQALEAETWLPILLSKRVIFAGDHQQLPPTVTSELAASKGLSQTMFGKLMKARPELSIMLQVQYRMHECIMKWASDAMYEGKLVAHDSVASHLLSDICPGVEFDEPFMLIDTAGQDLSESVQEDGLDDAESKFNQGEAEIAIKHAKALIESGLPSSQLAIITPYSGQMELLRSMTQDNPKLAKLEIGTVDSFQGREKEAIIISFVRSNDSGEIGFLSEIRRTNVAVTRARRHVCLIGDSDTLGRHPFYRKLVHTYTLFIRLFKLYI